MIFEKIEHKEKQEYFKPEIRIGTYGDVRTSIYFEALENLVNNDWDDKREEHIATKVKSYLDNLDLGIILEKYRNLKAKNDNYELLSWFSLVQEKSDKAQDLIIEQVVFAKALEKKEVENLFNEFSNMFSQFLSIVDFDFLIKPYIEKDIKERHDSLNHLKQDLKKLFEFFKVKRNDVYGDEYIYLPTNPLFHKNDASGIVLGSKAYINTKKDYRISEIHEVMHTFINPITRAIKFTAEEEEKIKNLAPEDLVEEYYYARSILNEMLIRTYRTGLKKENDLSFEAFKERVLRKSPSELDKFLEEEKERGFENIANNSNDFQNEDILEKYYQRYGYNEFKMRILKFYQAYADQNELNFAKYFKKNYKDLLK